MELETFSYLDVTASPWRSVKTRDGKMSLCKRSSPAHPLIITNDITAETCEPLKLCSIGGRQISQVGPAEPRRSSGLIETRRGATIWVKMKRRDLQACLWLTALMSCVMAVWSQLLPQTAVFLVLGFFFPVSILFTSHITASVHANYTFLSRESQWEIPPWGWSTYSELRAHQR